jgi:phthiocerol/phenolphthiocerol synthesis type-I polyketide synthase E
MREQLRVREHMNNSPAQYSASGVAIIGMSGRFPGAKNVDKFWQNLRDGVESIAFFSEEELLAAGVNPEILERPDYVKARGIIQDAELFDASFFGFNPTEASVLDPQQRLFMECAWEAIEVAGYDPETYGGLIGVFAGASMSTYLLNLYNNPKVPVGPFTVSIANDKDHLPTRISYKLNLKGPSVAVQTACSSSLVAVHMACQSLLSFQCDMALAGGAAISVPQKAGYFYIEGGIESPDGHCRAFDARANGTVAGSAVGVILLKRLADAIEDKDSIHAVILGSAINNDGSLKVGYTAPSVEGQAAVITLAQAVAEVEPQTISYVEAHGTGTSLGDPVELTALTQAFREGTSRNNFCAIGSVKTNIGHADTAAGVTGLIKTVLALKHQMIPPSLHFESPNPQIDFANSPFYVNSKLSEWATGEFPRRAGVSSFGIGGTNAHVIVEEAPSVESSEAARAVQLVLLSSKTAHALETATDNLAAHLSRHPDVNLADAAYTLQVGRRHFKHRRMLVCRDAAEAVTTLETREKRRVFTSTGTQEQRPLIFMFPGQASQYANMGQELYETEEVFAEQVDLCSELLQAPLGVDLRTLLYPPEEQVAEAGQKLNQTQFTQPALFVTEYALARLWMHWGVRPEAMIGHSLGEYVAACLSGVFSLEDALALVAARGRMMQHLPDGLMLAVHLGEEEVRALLSKRLSLAAVNSPTLCVVSGPTVQIEELQIELQTKGVICQTLRTSKAFHSAMMEPILETFLAYLKNVKLAPPQIPFVSNLTGNWITPAEATDRAYWARQLRHTVRFADGLHKLLTEPSCVLLEVGPGRNLSSLLSHFAEKTPAQLALSSLRHPSERHSDAEFLLNSVGKLWLAGFQIDWQNFHSSDYRRRLPLPTYPFERKRHWIEAPADSSNQIALSAETARMVSDAGSEGRPLVAVEEFVAEIPNSVKAASLRIARLPQAATQPQVAASSLLRQDPPPQDSAACRFLERTVKQQIEIMSEQLAQQGRVLSEQLELLR